MAFLEFHGILREVRDALARVAVGGRGGQPLVRDFGAKLRITAAALGCASQKDLCARFREANPGTIFELDRSYKWMQGRSLPRSAQVYEDWAKLLGTGASAAHLQSCTVDEFLDLVCARHDVSREVLLGRAAALVRGPLTAGDAEPQEAQMQRRLAGAYACYSHAWSPYFEGRIIRGSLVVDVAEGRPGLVATYRETIALGRIELSGQVTSGNRAVYLDLMDAAQEFRLSMCLFVPGTLASVLAGIMCGATFVDADPQPAATRIVIIRIPGAAAGALDPTNRYLNPTEEPLSSDLSALGVPVGTSAGLDALLAGFLRGDHTRDYIKVDAGEYSQLALAIDRLFIENDLVAGVRGFPARASRSSRDTVQPSRDTVQLVQG